MTVTITPRGRPQRRDILGGITRVFSDGTYLWLVCPPYPSLCLPLSTVAAIALDEDAGAIE